MLKDLFIESMQLTDFIIRLIQSEKEQEIFLNQLN